MSVLAEVNAGFDEVLDEGGHRCGGLQAATPAERAVGPGLGTGSAQGRFGGETGS